MEDIDITRRFLKNPLKSIPHLVVMIIFLGGLVYAINPTIAQKILSLNILKLVSVFILPECVSLSILLVLINGYHIVFKIKNTELSVKAITSYQLKVLPVHLMAYLIFFPFTLLARYIIRNFPYVSTTDYIIALKENMTLESYFFYLPMVLILGYVMVNVSLWEDYFKQYSNDEETKYNDGEPLSPYIETIKAKGPLGESILNIHECYYFTAADHSANIYHPNGNFRVGQTIAALERQINPSLFFKISPACIINISYLESYNYADNGQYILFFKSPIVSMTTTKRRMKTLKTLLDSYRRKEITLEAV